MDFWHMNPLRVFLAGGLIMWPILFASVWALAIVIEKLLYLRRIRVDTEEFLKKILVKIKQQKIKEAFFDCDTTLAPIGKILKAGILKHGRPREEIKEALEDASLYEIPILERNLSVLATIASVAPLLGLLGTVVGMVSCFQSIQLKATSVRPVTPGDLAGGIWEALLTTVAGLMVAIPTFLVNNYLVNSVNNLILEMERASVELVNFLADQKQSDVKL